MDKFSKMIIPQVLKTVKNRDSSMDEIRERVCRMLRLSTGPFVVLTVKEVSQKLGPILTDLIQKKRIHLLADNQVLFAYNFLYDE